MSDGQVQLDMGSFQPIKPADGGVKLEMGTYKPIAPTGAPNPNQSPTDMANDALASTGIKVQPPAAPTAPGELAKPANLYERTVDSINHSAPYKALDAVGNFYNSESVGAIKAAGTTAIGLDNLIRKGLNHIGGHYAEVDESDFGGKKGDLETHGAGESVGEAGENVLEFFTGEELIGLAGKVLKGTEAVKGASQLATILNKYPRVAKILHLGLRTVEQASLAAGQTAIKTGGDTEAAADAGLEMGATSLAFHGLSAGAVKFLKNRASTIEKIGGVDTVVPAEVRNARGTPQQQAGQAAIKNSAQQTLAGHLEEVNESRSVPPSAPALPERTGPYKFTIPQGVPVEETTGKAVVPAAEMPRDRITGLPTNPVEGSESARNVAELGSTASTVPARMMRDQPFMTSGAEEAQTTAVKGGGTLTTEDPGVMKKHLGNLNEIVSHPDFEKMPIEQQNAILEARADAQRQLKEFYKSTPDYHGNRPNFPQINIPETVKQVGSYTEAADHLEKVATDGYNSIADALNLNDISGGKFATIRNANRAAWDAYKGASSVEAMHAAELEIDHTNQQMLDLLHHDIGGAVTPKELDGFNDAYGAAQKLKYVAKAVDGAFSGNPAATKGFEFRGFDGNRLMSNLNRLEQKFGRASLERTVGKESLNTLYQVAELNRTSAARARFGNAIKPVVDYLSRFGGALGHVTPIAIGSMASKAAGLGWEVGAVAGEATAQMTKKVMNAILTNPKVAQNLIFALESGARPQNYGPVIGTMIQQMETSSSKEKKNEEDKTK